MDISVPERDREQLDELITVALRVRLSEAVHIERLVGFTNRSYRVVANDQQYVARICSPIDDELIGVNRQMEYFALKTASSAGLAPELIYFDRTHGHLVTRWVEAQPWDLHDYPQEQTLRRATAALRELHALPAVTVPAFSPFDSVLYLGEKYEHAVKMLPLKHHVSDPDILSQDQLDAIPALVEQTEKIAPRNRRSPHRTKLCHNDPCRRNFLVDQERVYLVDFECSGRNDPLYDLAALANTASASAEVASAILRAYFNCADVTERMQTHLDALRFVHDVHEALWFLLRLAHGQEYFESLRAFDTSYDFRSHFARLASGCLARATTYLEANGR